MAFSIGKIITFAKKLKRWWDQKNNSQDHVGDTSAVGHQEQHLWGQQATSSIHQSQNQINSQNPHFVNLRNQAIAEGTLMKQKFDDAHCAYGLEDGARAKALSNEGKAHQQRRNRLNKEAADWIFKENNRNLPSDTVDLHGLYVQESLTYAEKFINQVARNNGDNTLKIIVGKGLHSQNFQAKLKPAIEKLVYDHHLFVEFDHMNSGILLVQRNAPSDKIGLGPQVLRHLPETDSSSQDRCIIM